eukprot:TRINITY_DN22894_c0_g1_i1.p1 TRINITY_DN22894_c0_g1~~TRINITY_DN22894_c0_g1_i1.p1  ORF type:complete len:464 (+),score=89.58 TRINITY_DN22894_c0_g1_i1:84-1475(+)
MSGGARTTAEPGMDEATALFQEPDEETTMGCCGCFSGVSAALRRRLAPARAGDKQGGLRRRLSALLRRKQQHRGSPVPQSPAAPPAAGAEAGRPPTAAATGESPLPRGAATGGPPSAGEGTPQQPDAPQEQGGSLDRAEAAPALHQDDDPERGERAEPEGAQTRVEQHMSGKQGSPSPEESGSLPGLTDSCVAASSSAGASPAAPPAVACPPPPLPADGDAGSPSRPSEAGDGEAAAGSAEPASAKIPEELVVLGQFRVHLTALARSDSGVLCPAGLVAGASSVPLVMKLSCVQPELVQASLDRAQRTVGWQHPHLVRTFMVHPAENYKELAHFTGEVFGHQTWVPLMPKYWTLMERGVCDLHEHVAKATAQQRIVGDAARIPASDAVRWCKEICDGLDYMHCTLGFIHADLKPKNIILVSCGVGSCRLPSQTSRTYSVSTPEKSPSSAPSIWHRSIGAGARR